MKNKLLCMYTDKITVIKPDENIEKILLSMQNKDLIEIVQMSEEIYKTKEEINSILDYMNVILLKLSKQNIKYKKCQKG